jgi:hypothetical protein
MDDWVMGGWVDGWVDEPWYIPGHHILSCLLVAKGLVLWPLQCGPCKMGFLALPGGARALEAEPTSHHPKHFPLPFMVTPKLVLMPHLPA